MDLLLRSERTETKGEESYLFIIEKEANIYGMSAQMLNLLDDWVVRLQGRDGVPPILCLQCQPTSWFSSDLSFKGCVHFKNLAD